MGTILSRLIGAGVSGVLAFSAKSSSRLFLYAIMDRVGCNSDARDIGAILLRFTAVVDDSPSAFNFARSSSSFCEANCDCVGASRCGRVLCVGEVEVPLPTNGFTALAAAAATLLPPRLSWAV